MTSFCDVIKIKSPKIRHQNDFPFLSPFLSKILVALLVVPKDEVYLLEYTVLVFEYRFLSIRIYIRDSQSVA